MEKRMTVKVVKAPQAKGYSDAGASHTKRSLKGFTAVSGAPSEDIDVNNMTLRQRGRMLYMASPVAAAAINTNRTKIIGSGLRMKCAINNEILGLPDDEVARWQRNTEAEWKLWAERRSNCDALGVNNFYELEQLAVKSWLMSGDAFVLLKRAESTKLNPYTLRLHIIEADRVSTPFCERSAMFNQTEGKTADGNKIYDGVEIDGSGRVVAYHVCNVYPYQATADKRKWHRIEVEGQKTGLPNILQLMDAERPDQYRGVTYLAPVIELLLQLRRYIESSQVAALVQTYLTAWIITESDPTDFPLNEVGAGDVDGIPSDQPDSVSDSEYEYEMGPGQINHLKKGENIELSNPNIPTASFESFVNSIIKMAGAAMELPHEVLIKEFNHTYSAAKGALEEAWEMIKMRRSWFINDFCQPVYEVWLAEAVATGRIRAPGFWDDPLIRAAWCGARWDGPAQTHLDPVKEAKANELVVQHGWKTNEQVTREYYGGDWSENAAVISQEQQRLNSVTPDNQI